MSGSFIWVHADDSGETRLDPVSLTLPGPDLANHDETLVLRKVDVPATSVRVVELPKRGPREVVHPAPRRQLVIVLQGEMVLTATNGDSRRLRPGDCLLADDVDSKGHRVDDVGEANLVTFQIAIPSDWHWPADSPSRDRR